MEDNYTCVLCGAETDEELGLEVGDGWICEDCAACLSPWVSEEDLEFADTEDLEEQVSLREENQGERQAAQSSQIQPSPTSRPSSSSVSAPQSTQV